MLPHPAHLVVQILSQADKILAAQTPPGLILGGIKAQQDVFIFQTVADLRRGQSGRNECFFIAVAGSCGGLSVLAVAAFSHGELPLQALPGFPSVSHRQIHTLPSCVQKLFFR